MTKRKELLIISTLAAMLSCTASASYESSRSIKVIFSKKNFYNNNEPINSFGCAGDAKNYFDPQTDRSSTIKPNWLKNISLDITNANAPFGSSNSLFCSYGAATSTLPADCLGPLPPASCNVPPPPSNCAAFDDMQALTGYQTKAMIIGGKSCEDSTCSTQSDMIWSLSINDTRTLANARDGISFSKESVSLPTISSTSPLMYTAWAFGEIMEWIMGTGGVLSDGTQPAGDITVQRIYKKPTPGSISDPSTTGIEDATTKVNTSFSGLAGIWEEDMDTGVRSSKSDLGRRFGHSLTFISRRSPSLARRFMEEDTTVCTSPFTSCFTRSMSNSRAGWADAPYFLQIGGMLAPDSILGDIAALTPYRLRTNNGTGGTIGEDSMVWEWLSNSNWYGKTPNNLQPVIDLSTDGSVPTSWVHTDRFGRVTTPTGDDAPDYGIFPPRAFHRAVYDSKRDRVYIFGGITTNTNLNDVISAGYQSYWSDVTSASDVTPTSETWIFDPPGTEKPPTLGCRITASPIRDSGTDALPGLNYEPGTNRPDLSTFDPAALTYEQSNAVFPPGGCMQYARPLTATIETSTTADDGGTAPNYTQPKMRLEHAMAFDEQQGVAIMFGGCTEAPPWNAANGYRGSIPADPSSAPFDPLRNCNSRTSLLNDTWMFIPPESRESALVTSLSGSSTNYTFGRPDFISPLDPLTNGLPLYFPNGTTSMSATELQSYTNGTWIQLNADDGATTQSSSSYPLARASAAFWYDKSHQKFYLFGGKACTGTGSCHLLNDLWEYTPPSISACARSYVSSSSEVACSSAGTWRMVLPDNGAVACTGSGASKQCSDPAEGIQRPPRTMAATGLNTTRPPGDYNHYGDGFFTVSDSACVGQGPILGSAATSKELVGNIYIDIDRAQFSSTENLLINLKMLPFAGTTYGVDGSDNGDGTKLPGYHFNGTYGATTTDDRDAATTSDSAYIRVVLMVNPINSIESLFTQLQPRFRTYQPPGSVVIAEEFDIASSGTGQPIEKQIFVPLSLDSRINMIKIERVRGSVKFYDMTVTKF